MPKPGCALTSSLLCLQELKLKHCKFPHGAFAALGYRAAVYGHQKTYNGVCHHREEHAARGLPTQLERAGFEDENNAIAIAATIGDVRD